MTSFASLYESAGLEAQYTVNFEQESINFTDDLIVHQKNKLDRVEQLQKKIDEGKEQTITDLKETARNHYGKDFRSLVNPQSIFWNPNKKGYVLFNRPTKFYLLTPNSEGKFGKSYDSNLKELTFPADEKGSHETLELWGGMFWPGFGIGSAKVWKSSSQDYTFLWSKDQLYIMSGIHDDKKNHISICILARPGDITRGMRNGTFPLEEDCTFELLGSYATLLDHLLPALTVTPPKGVPMEGPFPKVSVSPSDTDKVMIGKSGYLILSSIKKLESTETYTTYSGDILWADGKWAGSPARPSYVRFYKDGHREYSYENQSYFKTEKDSMWLDFGNLIARHENL